MQYNDILNNLIEVAADHPEMTEEIMYKTCVQFFTDGYDSAAQERQDSYYCPLITILFRCLGFSFTI